jgi:hypothetical protein
LGSFLQAFFWRMPSTPIGRGDCRQAWAGQYQDCEVLDIPPLDEALAMTNLEDRP